jgi:hypothetical protein
MRPIEGAECGAHAEEKGRRGQRRDLEPTPRPGPPRPGRQAAQTASRCRTRTEWISRRYPEHERDMATRRAEAILRREAPIGIEPMMEVLKFSQGSCIALHVVASHCRVKLPGRACHRRNRVPLRLFLTNLPKTFSSRPPGSVDPGTQPRPAPGPRQLSFEATTRVSARSVAKGGPPPTVRWQVP